MPSHFPEFEDLLRRVREGDPDAVHRFIEDYGPDVRRVIRRKLSSRVRIRVDSIDVLQDVWAHVFTKAVPEQAFHEPARLMQYLVRVAENLTLQTNRRHLDAQKADVRRQCPLDSSGAGSQPDLPAGGPEPWEVLSTREEWARLLEGVPHEYRPLLALLRQGHSRSDVAMHLGVSVKTVLRMVERVRSLLEHG